MAGTFNVQQDISAVLSLVKSSVVGTVEGIQENNHTMVKENKAHQVKMKNAFKRVKISLLFPPFSKTHENVRGYKQGI